MSESIKPIQFEVPYNFDEKELDFLAGFAKRSRINVFFIAPFVEDYFCCKRYYKNTFHDGISNEPKDRKEFERHIRKALEIGLPIATMFQHPIDKPSDDVIKYYASLGFTRFIINQEEVALRVKELIPGAYVVGSITKKVTLQEAIDINSEAFDNLVLSFQFNRSFKMLDKLPREKEYTLLANCGCSIRCGGTHHWFAGDPRLSGVKITELETGERVEVHDGAQCPAVLHDSIEIPPQLLETFGKHGIHHFKLQGREYNTPTVTKDITRYLDNGSITGKSNLVGCLDQICIAGLENYYDRIKINPDNSTEVMEADYEIE